MRSPLDCSLTIGSEVVKKMVFCAYWLANSKHSILDSYASNRGGIAVGFKEVSFQTPPQKLKDTWDIMCSNNKVTDKVNRRLFQHFKYLPSEERKEVRLDQTESLQYAPKKNKRGSSLTSKNGNSNECIHFSGNKIRPIGEKNKYIEFNIENSL